MTGKQRYFVLTQSGNTYLLSFFSTNKFFAYISLEECHQILVTSISPAYNIFAIYFLKIIDIAAMELSPQLRFA